MNRFLLADNPMHPEQSGVWVMHTINPIAMIQCIRGHVPVPYNSYAHFSFINNIGELEEWTFSAHYFYAIVLDDDPEEEVQKLLRKSWRWYRAYLEFDR